MDLLPPQSSIDEFERERAEKKRRERDDMPILGGMNGLPPQWVIDEFNAE